MITVVKNIKILNLYIKYKKDSKLTVISVIRPPKSFRLRS